MPIYTRAGDRGWTRVLNGRPVKKDHARLVALGALDGLNASLGLARAFVRDPGFLRLLESIQTDLFSLGSHLAGGVRFPDGSLDALLSARVGEFEAAMDRHMACLPLLTAFILPGGTPGGALLHLARTSCRTAEQTVVSLSRTCSVSDRVIAYLNRLSDLLFVLARAENRRAGMAEKSVRTRAPARPLKRSRQSRPWQRSSSRKPRRT